MLEYKINSFGGQSGSPVLREDRVTSIGAHVYGGGDKNKASPIEGQFGNPYASYISVFDKHYPVATVQSNVAFVQVESMSTAPIMNTMSALSSHPNLAMAHRPTVRAQSDFGARIGSSSGAVDSEEGIFDILKK